MTDQAGGSDWTPQETLALVAPVFGLSLEQASDCIILVTDKQGLLNVSAAIEGTYHATLRERACRLIYIQSLLIQTLARVNGELHEEVHSE